MQKYRWLYEKLKQQIQWNLRNGTEKLPSEEAICAQYGLSRQTVRQSLALLETDGLITRQKGSGTYITGLLSDPLANKIAILLPNDREYLYPALSFDIQQELKKSGFYSQIYCTEYSFLEERNILEMLLADRSWRGVIAEGCKTTLPNPNQELYLKLLSRGTQLVFLQDNYNLPDSPCIREDSYTGGHRLTDELLMQGHTAIGGIFMMDHRHGIERYQGYLSALYEAGQATTDEWVCWYNSNDLIRLESLHDNSFLKRYLRESLSDCTAILCQDDEIAYWVNRELRSDSTYGQKLIASFHNSYLSHALGSDFLSLSRNPHILGVTASQTMVKKCKGLPVASQVIPWN